MPLPYRYVVDEAADDAMGRLPPRDQQKLRDFFRRLGANPFLPGDSQVPDANGRLNEVKGHGRFVVTYWPDHAVSEVRIAAVELA